MRLNCFYNLAQMKIMDRGTFFDKDHLKDDAEMLAWMNHIIVRKQDDRINVYEFNGTGLKPTGFKAATVEEAKKLIEDKSNADQRS
jgi:hypothetical protein